MSNEMIIKSLALDLKRIVQGEIVGSEKMTDRFIVEAEKWLRIINYNDVSERVNLILKQTEKLLKNRNNTRLADDALLYSNLLLQYSK